MRAQIGDWWICLVHCTMTNSPFMKQRIKCTSIIVCSHQTTTCLGKLNVSTYRRLTTILKGATCVSCWNIIHCGGFECNARFQMHTLNQRKTSVPSLWWHCLFMKAPILYLFSTQHISSERTLNASNKSVYLWAYILKHMEVDITREPLGANDDLIRHMC